ERIDALPPNAHGTARRSDRNSQFPGRHRDELPLQGALGVKRLWLLSPGRATDGSPGRSLRAPGFRRRQIPEALEGRRSQYHDDDSLGLPGLKNSIAPRIPGLAADSAKGYKQTGMIGWQNPNSCSRIGPRREIA